MQIWSNPISALNYYYYIVHWYSPSNNKIVSNAPKFTHLIGNQGWGTQWWGQILDWKLFMAELLKFMHLKIKSGSRNTMVTSHFSPEVEIWPFRTGTMHLAIIIGTVKSLWTWSWADSTFHKTYFWFITTTIIIYNYDINHNREDNIYVCWGWVAEKPSSSVSIKWHCNDK